MGRNGDYFLMHFRSPFSDTNFKINSGINSKISIFPRGDLDSFQIDAVANAANKYLVPREDFVEEAIILQLHNYGNYAKYLEVIQLDEK
jgi:hypothetical protein